MYLGLFIYLFLDYLIMLSIFLFYYDLDSVWAIAFITFSASLLSSLLLPSRCFQFLKLYIVKCIGAQIFQKCRSHLKIPPI